MPRLLLPQIKERLAGLADRCALALSSGDEAFLKRLEWWLADGVFNLEPHGMFRTEHPYGADDPRSVGDYLQQPTFHRWEGTQVLFDLFVQEVLDQLEAWVRAKLEQELPADTTPGDDEWEQVFAPEWEESLYLVGLHPRAHDHLWTEFLALPLAVVVENWRLHAGEMAVQRQRQAARSVSRHDLEVSMIRRVAHAVAKRLPLLGSAVARTANEGAAGERPAPAWEQVLSEIASEWGEVGPLEVALYVHSALFAQNVPPATVQALHRRYPLGAGRGTKAWTESPLSS